MSVVRSLRVGALCAPIVVFAAACADSIQPTGARTTALDRIAASSVSSTAALKHLVHFTGDAIPATFAARVASLGGTVDAAYDGVGIAVVAGLSAESASQLAADAGIAAVDPDYSFNFLYAPGHTTADATDAVIASPTNPAAAYFYAFQWNLRAIDADDAWAAGHLGSPEVKVAILDTGIDYLHPDLVGRVDLANSASFVPGEDPYVPLLFPGRLPFTDLHYHGTHVAATVSSNAYITAGVSSRTTLMAIKVIDVNGNGTASAILAGIVHATQRGAKVINMSLGVADLLSRKDHEIKAFERVTDRVFNWAYSRGVTVIVAAGNESQNLDTKQTFKGYCSSAHVVCVSATGPTSQGSDAGPWQNIDAPASYSNFGVKAIHVAAPGGNGSSFVWGPCSTTSVVFAVCQDFLLLLGSQGTSQATPHVSGVAALILARDRLPASALRERLLKSVDDLGPKGKDERYGNGRINVRKALGL